jgi:hypothetical protein
MRSLEFATIRESSVKPRTKHYVGLPPELTGNKELRHVLPTAKVVVLQQDDQGNAYLVRFTTHGEEVGDTWHTNITEAKGQAEFEYGDALSEWRAIPEGANDIAAFVRRVGR